MTDSSHPELLSHYSATLTRHAAEVALVDYFKEIGVEFDAQRSALELTAIQARTSMATMLLALDHGLSEKYLATQNNLEMDLGVAVSRRLHGDDVDYPSYHWVLRISPCDGYRIIDAIRDLPDADADIVTYLAGDFYNFYQEANFKQYVPLDKQSPDKGTEIANMRALQKDLATRLSAIIAETVKLELLGKHEIKTIQGGNTATPQKRTMSGKALAEQSFSECALNDFGLRILPSKTVDVGDDALKFTNGLTGRTLLLKSPESGVKKRVLSGSTAILTGADLRYSWQVTSLEEQDDA